MRADFFQQVGESEGERRAREESVEVKRMNGGMRLNKLDSIISQVWMRERRKKSFDMI